MAVVLVLGAVSMSASADGQRVTMDADIEWVHVPHADRLAVPDGLFNVSWDPNPAGDVVLRWTGASPHARLYWVNGTSVGRHDAAWSLARYDETLEWVDLPDIPAGLRLEPGQEEPFARLRVAPGTQTPAFADARDLVAQPHPATDRDWGWKRQILDESAFPHDFDTVPDEAGRLRFTSSVLGAGTASTLVLEGWDVTYQTPDGPATVWTGTDNRNPDLLESVPAHRYVTAFLVLDLEGAGVRTEGIPARFDGVARAPSLAMDGTAHAQVVDGVVVAGGARHVATAQEVGLAGAFQVGLTFPESTADGATGHLAASGRGAALMGDPLPSLAELNGAARAGTLPAGLISGLVVVALLGTGVTVARRSRLGPGPRQGPPAPAEAPQAPAPPQAAAPPASDPQSLVQRVRRNPMDAEAHLLLGARLVDEQAEAQGLKRLHRAFRLDPVMILRFLEEPRFEALRGHPGVRRLLARVHRDHVRRHWAGYA